MEMVVLLVIVLVEVISVVTRIHRKCHYCQKDCYKKRKDEIGETEVVAAPCSGLKEVENDVSQI
jgi:hypothetical protein